MNYTKQLSFLLLICTLASCATLKSNRLVDGQIQLTKDNLNLLNGTYSRSSESDTLVSRGDLYRSFTTFNHYSSAYPLSAVKIKVVNERKLEITLIKEDSIYSSKVFNGKIKNGYFEMKRKVFFVPAIFLNIFRTTKFRLGLLENQNLTTDFKQIAWGTGIFIIPFYEKEEQLKYEYVKEK